jgi:hypothetical protein
MPDKTGCIVMTLRRDREDLVVRTAHGPVVIEATPMSMGRTRIVIRAPKQVEIGRAKRPEGGTDGIAL